MALDAHIVHEMRATASNDNGGGTRWVALVEAATYKWTVSGSGTSEYYVELLAGGDPSLTEAKAVTTGGNYVSDTNGTVGSLNAGEWDWGDNDTLGYSTVYVRLDDGADPDTKNDKFVSMVFGGGIDYSLQDAAQMTFADGACVIASTTFTSATGGFTALMVGSLMYIKSGTNEVIGWFEITAYSDTNTVTIDRTACDGVGNATGITFFVGGARALPVDTHFEAWTAGNKMYIAAGTYTLTAAVVVANDGTLLLPMIIEGYNAVRGDQPAGTDRPLIAAAANTFAFDDYWKFKNFRLTSSAIAAIDSDVDCSFENIRVDNSSGTADRSAFFNGSSSAAMIDCEATCTNGRAARSTTAMTLTDCYMHDSKAGFSHPSGSINKVMFSIFDTCSVVGLQITGDGVVINNTIYNCPIGIEDAAASSPIIRNNLIDTCTLGASWATFDRSAHFDYNNWNGNTLDRTNVDEGPNATANAPGFTDAPGGDFSGVDSADGFTIRLGVG